MPNCFAGRITTKTTFSMTISKLYQRQSNSTTRICTRWNCDWLQHAHAALIWGKQPFGTLLRLQIFIDDAIEWASSSDLFYWMFSDDADSKRKLIRVSSSSKRWKNYCLLCAAAGALIICRRFGANWPIFNHSLSNARGVIYLVFWSLKFRRAMRICDERFNRISNFC